jgi:uncharacterized protein involved in exopolysaccharide biosynthesis
MLDMLQHLTPRTQRMENSTRRSIIEIIVPLYQSWLKVGIATVTVIVVALLYAVFAPSLYTAAVDMVIESDKNPSSLKDSSTAFAIDIADVETQMKILQSRKIALAVVRIVGPEPTEPKLISEIVAEALQPLKSFVSQPADQGEVVSAEEEDMNAMASELQNNLVVQRSGASHVVEIAYTSRDRRRAAEVANAIAKAYIDDQLESRRSGLVQSLRWMQERASDLAKEAEVAAQAVQSYRSQNNTSDPAARAQLRQLESSAQTLQSTYELVVQRFTELSQQQDAPHLEARIVSSAVPPLFASYPRRTLIVGLAAIAGISLSVAGAMVAFRLSRMLRTPQQVEELGLVYLASIPKSSSRRPRDSDLAADEGIVAVRNATISLAARRIRTIGVASIGAPEKKFANSLAECCSLFARTMLIDTVASISSPSDSSELVLDEILMGARSLSSEVQSHPDQPITRLRFSSENRRERLDEILLSSRLCDVIVEARKLSDFLVVNLPAVDRLPTLELLAPHFDSVIILAPWKRTSLDLVERLARDLSCRDGFDGIVFKDVPRQVYKIEGFL